MDGWAKGDLGKSLEVVERMSNKGREKERKRQLTQADQT
jgi:hypothetical protein